MDNDKKTCPLCGAHHIDQEAAIEIVFENAPKTREEAIFDSNEEDVLFDAYQMLRWVGVPKEKLEPVAITIELTTIYDREMLERYFTSVVRGEE